jgi:DNA-binding transcriptional LysR family regulator
MNVSTRQLRAFVAVARLQSFTRAAEQLHISQAGLSSMVRDTERQLGCRLFDRTTRAVSLTPQGLAFMPIAARVLHDLEDGVASLDRISSVANGTLAIGATPLVASSLLPAACESFAREHPEIVVSIHDIYRSDIPEQVQAGTLDAGFGVFLEETSGLRRASVRTARLVLAYSPSTVPADIASRVSVKWGALANVRLLGLPVDNPIQRLVDAHLATIGRGNEAHRSFNHLHTLLAMVEAGSGCALLPSFVAAASARYRVKLLPVAAPKVEFDFVEITKRGRLANPALALFRSHVVGALKAAEERREDGWGGRA